MIAIANANFSDFLILIWNAKIFSRLTNVLSSMSNGKNIFLLININIQQLSLRWQDFRRYPSDRHKLARQSSHHTIWEKTNGKHAFIYTISNTET